MNIIQTVLLNVNCFVTVNVQPGMLDDAGAVMASKLLETHGIGES